MLIKCIPVGNLEANCLIVTEEDSLSCAVIDPGDESNTILDYIEGNRLTVKAIFLTHGHYDHTGAVMQTAEKTGAKVYIHAADMIPKGVYDNYKFTEFDGIEHYGEGDTIAVGALNFHIMSTPGHSPGSVTIRCGDTLFTGDTLFRSGCGRCDLPGGNWDDMTASLKRLALLEGDFEIWPGHMDPTTLGRERAVNFYMKQAMEE